MRPQGRKDRQNEPACMCGGVWTLPGSGTKSHEIQQFPAEPEVPAHGKHEQTAQREFAENFCQAFSATAPKKHRTATGAVPKPDSCRGPRRRLEILCQTTCCDRFTATERQLLQHRLRRFPPGGRRETPVWNMPPGPHPRWLAEQSAQAQCPC